ncbi:MAG: glycosyltransferase family 2 protein, partial [Thermoleophilia bacterium]
MNPAVSIIIPAYNAADHLAAVIEAILAQDYSGPHQLIVVNDGSTDETLAIARGYEDRDGVTVIDQPNQGAVAATNNGILAAVHDIVMSVDSDVVLEPDFLGRVMGEFDDPQVAAVQGYYRTPPGVSFWARMMGYDVEARYDAITTRHVTQVCTGDTAYRRAALDAVGLFDPDFKYGYDNDMSYRLQGAGYRLVFRRDAVCDHYWKADLASYIRQQYRSGYGRLQLVKKHRGRFTGDSVSGLRMVAQVPLTLLFMLSGAAGAALVAFSAAGWYLLLLSGVSLAAVLADRLVF